MKSIKILALALLMFVALPSCNDDKNGGKNSVSELQKNIVGEWQLTDWNGAAQPFDVYVDFNEDGSFEMYQRVYELNYVLYTGTYSISGDILTGSYADGTDWKCGYKGEVAEDKSTLTLYSQEDVSLVSVYASTTIPEDVKAEASETRSGDVERFL